jgi:hypothetical protein
MCLHGEGPRHVFEVCHLVGEVRHYVQRRGLARARPDILYWALISRCKQECTEQVRIYHTDGNIVLLSSELFGATGEA